MEQRGYGLGVAIAVLGLILSCCLLPHLVSSVYSLAASLSQMEPVSKWLWGDWLNTIVGAGDPLYMFLAEGPICGAALVGLLIIVVGVVLAIDSAGEDDESEAEEGRAA
jgi:hypothetical protein